MKKVSIFLLAIWAFKLFAQDDKISNKWLVIISGFETQTEANLDASTYNFDVTQLNSNNYQNLNSGWFINCIPFETEEGANAKTKELKNEGINSYVKFSGKFLLNKKPLTSTLEEHYLVFQDEYLILEEEIESYTIDSVIGFEWIGMNGETNLMNAAVDFHSLPLQLQSMVGKRFWVQNRIGEQVIAKLKGFQAIRISSVYFGTLMEWKQQGKSEEEIIEELWDDYHILVGVLDLPEKHIGWIAHPFDSYRFCEYSLIDAPKAEQKIIKEFSQTDTYEKNMSLAQKSIVDGEYQFADLADTSSYYNIHVSLYQVKDDTIACVNAIWGDYCENDQIGSFYSNIYAIWNQNNGGLNIIEDFREGFLFDMIPLFSNETNPELIGFIADDFQGMASFFFTPDLKAYRSFEIPNDGGCH